MNRLRECREAKGMSQKFVALTINVKPPQISKWESETQGPSRQNCIKLAKLYGVSVDYLLGISDDPQQQKEPIPADRLDDELISLLVSLPPEDAQRVRDFVAGLKAAHTK